MFAGSSFLCFMKSAHAHKLSKGRRKGFLLIQMAAMAAVRQNHLSVAAAVGGIAVQHLPGLCQHRL